MDTRPRFDSPSLAGEMRRNPTPGRRRWLAPAGGLLIALAGIALWELCPGEWPAAARWGLGAVVGLVGGALLGLWWRRPVLKAPVTRPPSTLPPELAPTSPPPLPVATTATPPRDPLAAGLLTLAAEAVLTLDAQGGLLGLVEPEGRQHLRELVARRGLPLWRIPGVSLAAADLHALQRAVKEGRPWRDLAWQWQDGEGRVWPFRLSGLPRRASDGRVLGFGAVLREQQAVQRFHALFGQLPQPLLLHRGARLIDANPAALALLGLTGLDAVAERPLLDWVPAGADRETATHHLEAASQQPPGAPMLTARFAFAAPGRPVQTMRVRSQSVPGDEDDGAPVTLTLIEPERPARDPAASPDSAHATTLLSHLAETSPDAIALTELQTGRYAMVNATFERLSGYSAADLVGRTAAEIDIWANPEERYQLLQMLADQPAVKDLPATFRVRSGAHLEMLMSAARVRIEGQDYLMISARDVTHAEQTRLEYQTILDNALIGIALTRDEHFTMVNPRFEAMLGWPKGGLLGQHAAVVWPTPADHVEAGRVFGPRLGAGEQIEVEHLLKRRDGSVFLCRLLAKAVNPTHPSRSGTLWLAEDVTERRQIDQALAKARDDAEAANRAKSDFLANISHEIRTPLNALLGLARLARLPEVDEIRRRAYIEQISESAETLSAIITDILDLSKIEAGKMHLEHMPFALRLLLDSLLQAYGTLADTKGLTMRLLCANDVPDVVIGDAVRLRQILSNYLTNALKFTESGMVELTVQRGRGPMLRFEVRDTGPGISPEAQARLFTPFTQVDNSVNRRVGGTGLGLSICRQLAHLMDGEVGLASEPGRGSVFWAELPLPSGSNEELDASTGSDGLDPISGARVLMVEDNPVNMMIAVALLEQWGAQVAQAHDGAEAIEAVDRAFARGQPFDVVLMDVQMPGISGHEATRVLRRRYSRRRLPIVALTAAALVSERNQALAEGMNDFLTKPIDAQRLRTALVRMLREAQEED